MKNSTGKRSKSLIHKMVHFMCDLFGCSSGGDEGTATISRQEFQDKIGGSEKVIILDVRTEDEYRSGHIPNAINVPLDSVMSSPMEIPAKADETIVVYCEVGARAKRACKTLVKAGFQKVLHLEGDMKGWRAEKLPQRP